ncbi:MFS general substrate transporter [Conidiobolus coronatus NRRL 28638]|uniref:MFS general substrate transporter n=1 Tax=Conidiobolus coronatus (strain ATCC 28846 / CBS 209.66 / NRRL 28638) TaxID=796925 RepID=A0A137P0D0_CONC2|nr:MFS general substrate transporter [Conidiobolus coronatus NRRL 28638]|eukprot:KXN68533.1 MFS general substrate transporter [Conidiobolus coronatus NRRL 28638]
MSTQLTENTPLIVNEGGIRLLRVAEDHKRQVRVIYLIHFLSTISTSIFAFTLDNFIRLNRDPNKEIGINYRVQNFFIIGQILLSIVWGFYSDKIGRKTVLNICLLGSTLTTFLFGFSKSIGYATFISFLAGAFSCIYIIIKTMFGESINKSNRPLSFIYLIVIGSVAPIIGMLILAIAFSLIYTSNPPDQAKFPFLIACLIASIINIVTFILSHLYLNETLGNNVNLEENDNAISSTDNSNTLSESEFYTIFGLSISKDSILIMTGFPLIAFIFSGFWNIFIYWSSNEVSKGGLNLKLDQVINCLNVSSIISLVALLLYSSINKRLGSLKLYRNFFLPTAVVSIISSMTTLVAQAGNVPAVMTLLLFVFSAVEVFYYFQDISLNLLLIESSGSAGNLGTLFGVSNALEKTFSLILPSLFRSVYKFSTESGLPFPFNYNLIWVILTTTAVIGYWSSSKIKTK